MTLYTLTLEFWQNLKTAQNKLGAGVALANTEVAYFLANAGWQVAAGDFKELVNWYDILGLPPAIITPSDKDVEQERVLKEAGFTLERSFAFREPGRDMTSAQVEQVSWSQMRYAGDLLAAFYDQPENALTIAKSLTKAMQQNSAIETYLAYEDTPKGVMVTFANSGYLVAMLLVDKDGGLEHRLIVEAANRKLTPIALEMLPEGTGVADGLERWSIR